MTSASMEVAIWRLLEELNKHPCQICYNTVSQKTSPGFSVSTTVIGQHASGCDFWDKLQLMRQIISDNGDDRE